MLDNGWQFGGYEGATQDPLFGYSFMHQIYTKAQPDITTLLTVPVLWDKKTNRIVNNALAQSIRIFNTAFHHITGNHDDYYPSALKNDITILAI
jgi:putative glutathione S-transferase